MKVAFLILVLIHALIHLLGFVKAFNFSDIRELTIPISRPMGTLWLIAALLLLAYAILEVTQNRYAWLVGILGVLLSQILIIMFWKDAKFGTLPNILILAVSIMGYGSYRFHSMVEKDTARILAQSGLSGDKVISEADLEPLPKPVKKWLISSGMIGKPSILIGRVEQEAQMKMKPDQEDWMNATATQYTVIDQPAFIWTTRVKMNPLLYFLGRDKFEDGRGEMLIRMNSLISVVDANGVKLDEGSLQRYLGELVWFPSLAISPYITWEAIDDTSARATMDYRGTRGSGIFYFSAGGDFTRFSAMRYMGNDDSSTRHEWVLSVQEYREFEGVRVPSLMTATWKLPEGDWTWLKLEVTDLSYNEIAIASAENQPGS